MTVQPKDTNKNTLKYIDENESLYQPEVLIIGPGAEKGYYELGALLEIEKRKGLEKIKYISSCSIGSIIGLLIVIGFSIKKIIKALITESIFNILGDISLENVKNFILHGGLYSNSKLKKILTTIVENKMGYIPSMKQLYIFSGIEFSIAITSLNKENPRQFFNHVVSPDISCVDACLLSSNIPGALERIEYNGETIIDGAWSNPYPIEIYDNNEREILGIYIDDHIFLAPIRNNIQYFDRILSVNIRMMRDNSIKNSSDKCYHLGLTTSNEISSHISPTLFDKCIMLKRGISLAKGFLDQLAIIRAKK